MRHGRANLHLTARRFGLRIVRIETPDFDEQSIRDHIEKLRAIAARDTEPANLRRIAASGAEMLEDALTARVEGKPELVSEILEGTLREDGRRSSDGLLSILPKWARGTEVLDDLAGAVVVDDSAGPPTVTVHWERVPSEHRAAAASLASELVDAYYGRPRGGRPKKGSESETG